MRETRNDNERERMNNDALISHANKTITILSASMLEDLAMSKAMDFNKQLSEVLYLCAVVQFAIIEVSTILKAMMCAKTPYAKRYHYKNLIASTSECYKMLYHFGKFRKHSIWCRFKNIVEQQGTSQHQQQYAEIINSLNIFGDTQIDKNMRDMVEHYSKDMLYVYRVTVSLKSEDDAAKYYCYFTEILCKMHRLVSEIKEVRYSGEVGIIGNDNLQVNQDLLKNPICKVTRSNNNLKKTVDYILDNAPRDLDLIADTEIRLKNFIERIEKSANELQLSEGDDLFREMQVPVKISTIQMLLRMVFNDVMAVCEAYFTSINTFEASLHMRRLVIHETAMMTLLYGYEDKEGIIPIWKNLEMDIPAKLFVQKKQIDKLLQMLNSLVNRDKRHAYVHIYEKNGQVILDSFVAEIEKLDFDYEFCLTSIIALLYGKMMKLLTNLMLEISVEKHRETEERSRKLLSMFDSILEFIQKAPMDDVLKKQRLEQMNILKQMLAAL